MPRKPGSGAENPTVRLRPFPRVEQVWPIIDALLYNVMTMNPVVMFSIPLLAAAAFYPSGNLVVAILMAGAFCTAEAVVYAFLASTFPRSGGDYVFQSRIFSGAAGTVFAFTAVVLGGAMWMGIAGWFACNMAVGPFVVLMGHRLHSSSLAGVGDWLLSRHGLFALSLVVTGWSALVNVWGMRVYALLQRAFWITGGAALAGLAVMFFLLPAHSAANVAVDESIVSRAVSMGFDPARDFGFLGPTLAMIPLAAFPLIYPGWSVQQNGEIKQASRLRSQLLAIAGGEVLSIGLALLIIPAVVAHFGKLNLGAGAFLFFHYRQALDPPIVPFLGMLGRESSSAGWPLFLAAVLFNAWFWMWAPDITLAASRVLLAMSADRLLPRWMGEISAGGGAPIKAVALFSAVCVVTSALYAYAGLWRLTLDAALLNVIAFAVTCAAGALFPWTKRELYRQSTAARYEVLGIPLITVLGFTFLAFTGFLAWRFAIDRSLALGADVSLSVAFVGAQYLFSLALYVGFRGYRRRREGAELEVFYTLADD